MNKMQSQIVEMLLNSLPDALAVYRFGSWGTQHERRESDIDLAILPLQPLSPQARWETSQKLAQMLTRDVDLVDLRAASTVMKLQVIVQGERLYCRDEAAVGLFETTVFSEYARLNEERREILADIKARGSVYAG